MVLILICWACLHNFLLVGAQLCSYPLSRLTPCTKCTTTPIGVTVIPASPLPPEPRSHGASQCVTTVSRFLKFNLLKLKNKKTHKTIHPFLPLPSSLPCPALSNHQSVLCIYKLGFFFPPDSTYTKDHKVFVFLCLPYFT